MKINPVSNPNILRSYQSTQKITEKTKLPSGRDEVTFSEEALSFSKIVAELESRSTDERARIADITNAVNKGEYKVDSEAIADKILESVLRR